MKLFQMIAIGALLCVSGCASNYANKSADEVAKAMSVRNSEFDSSIRYIAPPARSDTRRGLFEDNQTVQLYASLDKNTKALTYYVYVRVLYSFDWRFYNSVSFTDGTTKPTTEKARKVNSCTGIGCIYTEEIIFPIEYARLASRHGMSFRLNSKKGASNTISLPSNYVDGFILGLQKVMPTQR